MHHGKVDMKSKKLGQIIMFAHCAATWAVTAAASRGQDLQQSSAQPYASTADGQRARMNIVPTIPFKLGWMIMGFVIYCLTRVLNIIARHMRPMDWSIDPNIGRAISWRAALLAHWLLVTQNSVLLIACAPSRICSLYARSGHTSLAFVSFPSPVVVEETHEQRWPGVKYI